MGGVQLQQQLQQQLLRKTPELIRLIFNCGSVNDVGSWLIGFLQKISKIEGQQHLCLHKWKLVLVDFFWGFAKAAVYVCKYLRLPQNVWKRQLF